jgi:hypothetical protein
LKLVTKPGDLPDHADETTKVALEELFGLMFPGNAPPEIDNHHLAIGALARDPRLAIHLVKTTGYIAKVMPWVSQRPQLREIAIQSLNLHYRSEYSFQARIPNWKAAGLSLELLAQLPLWQGSSAFDAEQRLVVEYTLAVAAGVVPANLWDRVVARYGEDGALEFTVGVAWWSLWAMIVNATGIHHDFG